MRTCIFEDHAVRQLEPLTLTRPASALLCGALTLQQRQAVFVGADDVALLVRPALEPLCRQQHVGMTVNDGNWLQAAPTLMVNARWLPPTGRFGTHPMPCVGMVGDQVAYAILNPELLTYCSPNTIDDCMETWRDRLPREQAGGMMVDRLWDLVEANAAMLGNDLATQAEREGRYYQPADVAIVGPSERLRVDPSATLEPHVVVDTTRGPVIIDQHAIVEAFSRLEGPCYVGPHAQVLGGKIRGSTIGPHCRVGGEVEASILLGYVNKYHDGFLGHSYVGEWVNFGAGTQVSDLRHDYQEVSVPVRAGHNVATGLTKVGAFIGDHTKFALNTLLNTGSVIGAFSSVLPTTSFAPRYVPSFCTLWHGEVREQASLLQLLTTAATVMRRRNCELTANHATLFRTVYDDTMADRARATRTGKRRTLRMTG